jgi:hypothetical protein
MTSERRHRHVLDELLARTVQAPPRRSMRPRTGADATQEAADAWAMETPDDEPPAVRAPRSQPAAVGVGGAGAPGRGGPGGDPAYGSEAEAPVQQPAQRSPIIRGARAQEPRARGEAEVQVGRGPLALHLSRAATEERLAQTGERLQETERRLGEAGTRLAEMEHHLMEAQGRLTQTEGQLAEARKHVLATEERLAMTEESERHAREEQLRSEQARQALAAQLREREQRESDLRRALDAERSGRTRSELDLERLRGSIAALGPIVSGIDRATAEIRSLALAHARPADSGRPESAVTDFGSPARAAGSGSEGGHEGAGEHASHARTGEDERAGGLADAGASAPAPPGAGIVRALADAVEHWRGPGPRPGAGPRSAG